MLTIRDRQLSALSAPTRETFLRTMVRHVEEHFPEITSSLGAGMTRQRVELAWKLADRHHFVTEYGVCQIINLVFACGDSFEESAWAAPHLCNEGELSESARADLLYRAALQALEG